jgi:hypothetical protein
MHLELQQIQEKGPAHLQQTLTNKAKSLLFQVCAPLWLENGIDLLVTAFVGSWRKLLGRLLLLLMLLLLLLLLLLLCTADIELGCTLLLLIMVMLSLPVRQVIQDILCVMYKGNSTMVWNIACASLLIRCGGGSPHLHQHMLGRAAPMVDHGQRVEGALQQTHIMTRLTSTAAHQHVELQTPCGGLYQYYCRHALAAGPQWPCAPG